jgi:hypothetical protein
MAQDLDTLSAGLERLIKLADLARQVPPERYVLLAHRFQIVGRAFQRVVLAHQRATRLAEKAEATAVHWPDKLAASSAELLIMDDNTSE